MERDILLIYIWGFIPKPMAMHAFYMKGIFILFFLLLHVVYFNSINIVWQSKNTKILLIIFVLEYYITCY